MFSQITLAFLLYFLILLSIGIFSTHKLTSSSDFIMGNRTLNYWLTALTAHASDMSAWLFMAFPAAIMIGGLPKIWIAVGLLLGMLLNWIFVAKKLRLATEKYNSYTLSTFFERRFHDQSGTLRILTALVTTFFMIVYIASGLMAMGLLLQSVFGINYYIGISIAMFVVVSYTFLGGFVTVAWTDSFQAVFLLLMILLVPIIAYSTLPGWNSITSIAHAKEIDLTLVSDYSFQSFLDIIFLMLMWGLGYFGMPHIVTKFMGIKDPNEVKKATLVGISWEIIVFSAAVMVGLVGIAYFPHGLHMEELVFIEMVKTLFNPFIGGFILCAVFAASMSTMDSQILVCASVLSEDFYKHIIHRNASPMELLKASRISVILVSIISMALAFEHSTSVMSAVTYAWSGLGASFGPIVLMSQYSKTANRYGAISGIVIGGLTAAFWPVVNPYMTEIEIPQMIPGFGLSLLAIWLISKMTGNAVNETTAEYPA